MYLLPLPLPFADSALDAQRVPHAFGRVAHATHGVVAGDGQQLEAGVEQQHLRGPPARTGW